MLTQFGTTVDDRTRLRWCSSFLDDSCFCTVGELYISPASCFGTAAWQVWCGTSFFILGWFLMGTDQSSFFKPLCVVFNGGDKIADHATCLTRDWEAVWVFDNLADLRAPIEDSFSTCVPLHREFAAKQIFLQNFVRNYWPDDITESVAKSCWKAALIYASGGVYAICLST